MVVSYAAWFFWTQCNFRRGPMCMYVRCVGLFDCFHVSVGLWPHVYDLCVCLTWMYIVCVSICAASTGFDKLTEFNNSVGQSTRRTQARTHTHIRTNTRTHKHTHTVCWLLTVSLFLANRFAHVKSKLPLPEACHVCECVPIHVRATFDCFTFRWMAACLLESTWKLTWPEDSHLWMTHGRTQWPSGRLAEVGEVTIQTPWLVRWNTM